MNRQLIEKEHDRAFKRMPPQPPRTDVD